MRSYRLTDEEAKGVRDLRVLSVRQRHEYLSTLAYVAHKKRIAADRSKTPPVRK